MINQVFLSYSEANRDQVETIAQRLKGDGRLTFWFEPWHAIPGQPLQEQMEDALAQATSCAVFIGSSGVEGWQNEQIHAAIQAHVEDDPLYRVIPVLLPGVASPKQRDLPRFLRLYHPVHFAGPDDDQAFRSLLAGILGIAPIEVEGFLSSQVIHGRQKPPPPDGFAHGHALLIGVAHYLDIHPHLPCRGGGRGRPGRCVDRSCPLRLRSKPSYAPLTRMPPATQSRPLGRAGYRMGRDDTALIYFSGHGYHNPGDDDQQYILPYDARLDDLDATAIRGDAMTAMLRNVKAGRLLVIFDSCHSGGAADPKTPTDLKHGLSETTTPAWHKAEAG